MASSIRFGWLAFLLGAASPLAAQSGAASLDPEIAGIAQAGCLAEGGAVTIDGARFGPGGGLRLVAIMPSAGLVDLKAGSWTDTRIVAALPDDPRLEPGRIYALGVALQGADLVLSNTVTAQICPGPAQPTLRPHSAVGNLPPAIYANLSAPATQRDGALRSLRGFAPHPVAPPSQTGSNSEQTLPIPG